MCRQQQRQRAAGFPLHIQHRLICCLLLSPLRSFSWWDWITSQTLQEPLNTGSVELFQSALPSGPAGAMCPAGKVFSTRIRGQLRQSGSRVLSITLTDTSVTCVTDTDLWRVWTRARRIRLKVRGAPSCAMRWDVGPLRIVCWTRTRSENCSAAGVDHADNSAHRHGFLTKLLRPVQVGAQLTSAEGCEVRRRCLSLKIRSDPSQRLCQTFIHRANVWPTSEWNVPVPPAFFVFFFFLEIMHCQPE